MCEFFSNHSAIACESVLGFDKISDSVAQTIARRVAGKITDPVTGNLNDINIRSFLIYNNSFILHDACFNPESYQFYKIN